MTVTTPEFAALADRIGEASAQLAAYAESQGVDRAETAAYLAAGVVHAATTDPAREKAKEQLHADTAAFNRDTGAYNRSFDTITTQLNAYLDRLAALADEVIAFTDQAEELDARGRGLALMARSLGEDIGVMPPVLEGVVQALRRAPEKDQLLSRLLLSSRRGRAATIASLAELTRALRPAR
ncbi:hypothetical protein [Streptacidiphilus sp. EB103A]|uniref:hypothetical protein n=1 Tax=Streptacidiphilus sp. EB103A TaxID=3156275 RepID=UPI0035160512